MDAPEWQRPIAEDLTLRNTDDCARSSILCERPTDTRQPIHTGALLAVMGIGLFALVIAVIWRHLERRADRGEQ